MCFFRRKPKPTLIDLHDYERQCMRRKREGIPTRPPLTPMAIKGKPYSGKEKAINQDNQRQAMEIYEHYKNA